jgi:hypothetical protein
LHPVRRVWPLRNHRFLCSRLRSTLSVERLGMQTRLTPFAFAAHAIHRFVERRPVSPWQCAVESLVHPRHSSPDAQVHGSISHVTEIRPLPHRLLCDVRNRQSAAPSHQRRGAPHKLLRHISIKCRVLH